MIGATVAAATTEPQPHPLGVGLSTSEVAERTEAGLSNRFDARTGRTGWQIIRANVFTLFNAIVAACFLLLLLLGRWQDALFGLSALANAVIGSVQEFRAKATLERLALLHAADAHVIRDGQSTSIAVEALVVDDALLLRTGDQVPADAVVAESSQLELDESMLTGESDPIGKGVDDEVLSGSFVVGGSGLARVVRVGASSYANGLAADAKRFSLVASELRTSLNRVLRMVSWIVGPVALLVLNGQMVSLGGWPAAIASGAWREAAVSTVASLIAMIPLGLVLMTSIAFAVGAVKLSRREVLIQELAAVEGLARVDVICVDKTGTLTEGEIRFDREHVLESSAPEGWRAVLAWFATDPAANATAHSLAPVYERRPSAAPIGALPFSSARKWSAVQFGPADTAYAGSWVFGAPDVVLPPGDARQSAASFAHEGFRALVLAYSPSPLPAGEQLPDALSAVALVTLAESIRPDARETLGYFAEQGVAVKVISGDNPLTVAAVARRVGMDVHEAVDGRDLPEDEQALARVLEENTVFGRVTPEQKRAMVAALQSSGRTVAMTGDGVNDAMAIKDADVGIAMGSGAPATRAVARLVLLDGRFSRLPSVVAEGRQVIANIENVSVLFLTKTAYATGLAVLFGAFSIGFPFLPRQLSVIDGLTIGLPAFFLALMANRRRYRPGFLRRSLSVAMPWGAAVAGGLFGYSRLLGGSGLSVAELRTGSTALLALVALGVLVRVCRPLTTMKALVVGGMVAGLVALYSVPLAREFLHFQHLRPEVWLVTIGVAAATVALGVGAQVAVAAAAGRRGTSRVR